MIKSSECASLPFVAKALRAYLRTSLRGQTRLTFLLAGRVKSLQAVPIRIADLPPLYVDLRQGRAHDLLKGSPYDASPWEVDEQTAMRRFVREGDVVYDIGANMGLHTILLSRLVGSAGRVCAFEPNAELLPALSRTVEGLDNAALYPYALSDKVATSVLFIPDDPMKASLADWTGACDVHQVTCEQRRLDDLVEGRVVPLPDFIKCDVEGAELMVFEGGRRTLDRVDAPIILFEANAWTARGFGLTTMSAMRFLASLEAPRYAFFSLQEDGVLTRIQTITKDHANILAVPNSKVSSL